MQEPSEKEMKIFLQMMTGRMEFYHFEAARRRVSLRLDQKDIARKLQIEPEEYARIERGTAYPTFVQAIQLADLLHMLPSELIWIGPPIGILEDER